MSNLFLCFIGDTGLWDNIILLPAYPRGFSYFRPFRYTDSRIQPTLLDEIERAERRASLGGETVTICMRFSNDNHRWLLLPIREAEIIKVRFSPEEHSVYFRLGRFFDFGMVNGLAEACIELPETERNDIGDSIFFRSQAHFEPDLFYDADNEGKVWAKYCDLVAQDFSLPINENARRSLFLRFEAPAGKKPPEVSDIYKSYNMGNVYGARLKEGETYELVVSHRLPAFIGKNNHPLPIAVEFGGSNENFEITPANEDVTGNYQAHVLTVSAKKPSGSWEQIRIRPDKQASAQDGSEIKTFELMIPIRIKYSFGYRLKTTYLWLAIFWLSLLASIIFDKFLGVEQFRSNAFLLVVGVGITTAISSLMVFILQQRNISVK